MGDSGASQKRKSRIVALLNWCIDPKRGAHWIGMGATTILFVGAWLILWNRTREEILQGPGYRLTAKAIEITPTPPWIRTNITRDVQCTLDLAGRNNVLDPELPRTAGEAFAEHPWVREVKRVTVVAGPRLIAELVYRKPVCMVDLETRQASVLFPIDEEAVSLPDSDFTAAEKIRYLRLVGIERPQGPPPPGERWRDTRVVEAVRIAKLLEEAGKRLDLDRIVPHRDKPGQYEYILCTRGGTCIEWGRAPGSERPNELSAEEKVVKLLGYADKHGSLQGPTGAPQIINVRYDLKTSPRTVRSYLDELLR